MTSMSGTNHTQFHKIVFSADRRCPRQLQGSNAVYNNGLYTTWLFSFNHSVVSLGFEINESTRKELVFE